MSYQVIARKCRPQTFEEVVGQKHVSRTLQNAIKEERVAHAFLFSGERGVGKTSVARIMAKALNCSGGPTEHPCGTCSSCVEITEGRSLDVLEIDGASNTGVDDIRSLRENVKYRPSRDRYKIYIIDEVHMLSTSAFNALLKTLEEPPAHVIFMFATTEPQKIPDTILSRCLRFDFKRIAAKEITGQLEQIAERENISLTRRSLALIAREADGSMRDAQTLFERAIAYCGAEIGERDLEELLGYIDRQVLQGILDSVVDGNAQNCMQGLADFYDVGGDLRQFYYSFLELLRDVMLIKLVGDVAGLLDMTQEDAAQLQESARRASQEDLQRCFRIWFGAENEVVRSSAPKIALEINLLEMICSKSAVPIDDVLQRLEGVSQQLAGMPAGAARPAAAAPVRTQPQPQCNSEAQGEAVPAAAAGGEGDAFVAFIRSKHPLTAAKLAQGTVRLGGDGTVTIGFPEGSFFIEQLQEKENDQRLRDLGREFFQKPVQIVVVD
ncbi:MAG: DNA polymerase III subunit gamma/tau [Deltaproteobacteria bacterium]|nr:DNA polymerase III subunit gamma/tau [Deltaproteobacteria bacterium]